MTVSWLNRAATLSLRGLVAFGKFWYGFVIGDDWTVAAAVAAALAVTWLLHTGARIGAELGLPLQIHTGFGDPDEHLSRADPLLLTEFLRSTQDSGLVVMLLHCWPYHRNASYLAHVFPHVLMDLGLTIPHVGARSAAVLAEALEVAPFGAVCFSSDGYGLPELHYLGARLWRQYCGRLVDQWLADDVLTVRDAERLIAGIAAGNAAQVYGIEWP